MSSRWKKVLADLWGNKVRTLLTVMTIAVGTFAVGFNSNMRLYMNESMESDFLSANPSGARVYAGPMDDDTVAMALEVAGVEAVEGRSVTDAKLIRPGEKDIAILFTAVEDPAGLTVNKLKPAGSEGRLPALHDREILIDSSAASLGFEVGDVMTVELADGKQRNLTLGGYVHDAAGFPFSFSQSVAGFVNPKTMTWLGGTRDYNLLALTVTERQTDQDYVEGIGQQVADRIARAGATVYYVAVYQPGHHFAYSVSQGMFFVLGALGWLTVLLSGFLVINTITALMTQQVRQIGIMKATGAHNMQIFTMYAVLILAFGMGALIIAVPLANAAARTIGDGMAAWLNFLPATYRGYPSTMIQQAAVALVVPLLAAMWPLYNSVRVTVREALSDYGIGSSTVASKSQVSKAALLIPRPIRLSLRNALRRRARLALTLFTLVLAGGIFIAVYNLWASFDRVIDEIQGYFLADVNIAFARGYRYDGLADIALTVPGVESVEGWLQRTGTLNVEGEETGRQVLFVAPPSDSTLIDPIISAGRWLQPGDENAVVIGNHLLNMFPGLRVGDELDIELAVATRPGRSWACTP